MPTEQRQADAVSQSGNTSLAGDKARLTLQLNVIPLCLALLMMPVLLALGFWQLERADQKRTLLAEHRHRQSLPPINLDDLTDADIALIPPYSPVTFTAQFDNKHVWLLDNKIQRGQFGYQVLQPVALGKSRLIVNRGWLAGSLDRSQLPEITPLEAPLLVLGQTALASRNAMMDDRAIDQTFPKRINQINFVEINAELGQSVAQLIQLDPGSAGAFSADWPPVNISPDKHMGYAVQWFAMAFALFLLVIFANSNLALVLKSRFSSDMQDK